MSKRVLKKELAKMEKLLRSRPRTSRDLLKEFNGEYLHILRKLDETEPVLTVKRFDEGVRFKYWIQPKRMGKNWKRIYASLMVPPSYDIRISDYSVQARKNEVE